MTSSAARCGSRGRLQQGYTDTDGATIPYVIKNVPHTRSADGRRPSTLATVFWSTATRDGDGATTHPGMGVGRQIAIGHVKTDGIMDICVRRLEDRARRLPRAVTGARRGDDDAGEGKFWGWHRRRPTAGNSNGWRNRAAPGGRRRHGRRRTGRAEVPDIPERRDVRHHPDGRNAAAVAARVERWKNYERERAFPTAHVGRRPEAGPSSSSTNRNSRSVPRESCAIGDYNGA